MRSEVTECLSSCKCFVVIVLLYSFTDIKLLHHNTDVNERKSLVSVLHTGVSGEKKEL